MARPQLEVPLGEERRICPNNSASAVVTKEFEITHSLVRSVVVEEARVTAQRAGAGVTILGFASIRSEVLRQIGAHHSVTEQSSLSITEKVSITIQPRSSIEHVIRWKAVHDTGTVSLGRGFGVGAEILAEVPYRVPRRLTFADEVNDIPLG